MEAKTGAAVAALVCGVIGLVCCPPVGLVGVILGIVALLRVRRQPHRYGGKGMALGGVVTGGLSVVFLPMLLVILWPSIKAARQATEEVICLTNMTQLHNALNRYALANLGEYPPDLQTLVDSGKAVEDEIMCPIAAEQLGDTAALYIYISSQNTSDNPDNILLYENIANHGGEGANVLYRNGAADYIEPASEVERIVAETVKRVTEARSATQDDSREQEVTD